MHADASRSDETGGGLLKNFLKVLPATQKRTNILLCALYYRKIINNAYIIELS